MPLKTRKPSQSARAASRRMRALADAKRAQASAWFFRTGPGEYGEGDRFRGVATPMTRREAKVFERLPLREVRKLLGSPWHEERLLALFVLVRRYERANVQERGRIFRFYLAHTHRVNNWDLVDASAPYILGAHLTQRRRAVLRRLARSPNLWRRRIAIVSTLAFIRRAELTPTFDLAGELLGDSQDLIHKAAGWMLREAGKRNPHALRGFLARHAQEMPRTMLRYAIERFPERERRGWLARRSMKRGLSEKG